MTYTKEQEKLDAKEIRQWKERFIIEYIKEHPEITKKELDSIVTEAKYKHFKVLAQKIWVEIHT